MLWTRSGEHRAAKPRGPAGGVGRTTPSSVLYTSGSTGKPKGAVNLTAGICNYLLFKKQIAGAGPGRPDPVHNPDQFRHVGGGVLLAVDVRRLPVVAKTGGQREPAPRPPDRPQKVTTACFVPTMLRMLLEERRAAAR